VVKARVKKRKLRPVLSVASEPKKRPPKKELPLAQKARVEKVAKRHIEVIAISSVLRALLGREEQKKKLLQKRRVKRTEKLLIQKKLKMNRKER
jgi:hypothetical protein